MRSDYETRAIHFIHQIYDYIIDCCEDEDYANAIGYFNMANHRKVQVQSGQTRVAFITSDYVVKITYGSDDAINSWGDCEDEMEMYEQAEEDGYAYMFAKITHYSYRDKDFYIMPRINGVGSSWNDATEYMTDDEYNWCRDKGLIDLHCHNYGWRNRHICLIDYAAHL